MTKPRRGWLVDLPASGSRILYCSTACAEEDGVDLADAPVKRITQEEYEAGRVEYGAYCPLCDKEYEEF